MFLAVPKARCSGQSTKSANQKSLTSEFTYHHSSTSLLTQSKEELKNLRAIQNGFYVANLYQRFEIIDKVLFILVSLNFMLIAIDLELQLRQIKPVLNSSAIKKPASEEQLEKIEMFSSWILWTTTILTGLTITCSLFRHSLQSNYLYVQKIETSMRDQIFEIMILVLQPYPFFEDAHVQLPVEDGSIGYIDIKLNFILMIISMSQFLLMVRYWFWHNLAYFVDIRSQKFFKPSYNRICKIYSCENSYEHIMRCLFKENFIVFITGFYLLCLTMCAYCLRITESHFDGRFVDLGNCMWFALLSMTTVGYGDIFVSTQIGIMVDSFLMFSGVVMVSLLVSSLNDLFSMGYREKRALTLMKRLKDKGSLKEIASLFIARCLQRNWLQKKTGKRLKISQQERISCRIFHEIRMQLKCGKQKQLNLYRDMSNQFESLKLQLSQLMDTCEDDIQQLSQKQRLTLNRDSNRSINRSSTYINMIKLKSRDSRVSLMQPIFNNNSPRQELKEIKLNTAKLLPDDAELDNLQRNDSFKIQVQEMQV